MWTNSTQSQGMLNKIKIINKNIYINLLNKQDKIVWKRTCDTFFNIWYIYIT